MGLTGPCKTYVKHSPRIDLSASSVPGNTSLQLHSLLHVVTFDMLEMVSTAKNPKSDGAILK